MLRPIAILYDLFSISIPPNVVEFRAVNRANSKGKLPYEAARHAGRNQPSISSGMASIDATHKHGCSCLFHISECRIVSGIASTFFHRLCSPGKQLARLTSSSLLAVDETRTKPGRATGAQMAGQSRLVARDDGHKTAIAGVVHQPPFFGQIGIGLAAGFRLRIIFSGANSAR